ncbi:MAG: Snf7 family protein [Candidatus Bathyarchaeota archaeon]|nr:Snf7 family protein [Candidatus Bathyarchaeota archaeon]
MHKLRVQQQKVVQASLRLKERDKSLFQTCVNALKANNRERAAICANELAEVRRLISFLQQVELALERVILRLETVRELSDIVVDLKPALKTLQSVSRQLSEILPEVSSEINEINDVIGETIYSTKISADEVVIPVDRVTPAGEQILNEVASFLEKRIAEKLPEPPATQEAPKLEQAKAEIKQMVALAASCSQTVGETVEENGSRSENLISFRKAEIQEISLKVAKPSLEEALLEYVRRSGGEIDLIRCSSDLGASCEEVEKALQSLGAKGKVKIEVKR